MLTFYRHKKNPLGFTLVELLLSVTILSFGLTAILQAFMTITSGIQRTESISEASLFLDQKMEETILKAKTGNGLEIGSSSGTFGQGEAPRYAWNVNIKKSSFSKKINAAVVSISWTQSGDQKSLASVVMVNNPSAKEETEETQ